MVTLLKSLMLFNPLKNGLTDEVFSDLGMVREIKQGLMDFVSQSSITLLRFE